MTLAALRPRIACRLCGGALEPGDDRVRQLHTSCALRPEARRLGPAGVTPGPRGFTAAEKSLIRNVSAFMPAADLLRLLNERLVADLGEGATPYTLDQLHAEIGGAGVTAKADEWGGLRRLVADARKSGVLDEITPAVIDDFAVVFRLTPAQVTTLKDVVLHAQEDR